MPRRDTQGIRQVVRLSRSQFPYVIIDLDNTFTAEQVSAMISSDVILLVLRPDMLSLKNARRVLETLEHLGVADDRIKIVVNRYGQRGQLSIGKVEHAIGTKVIQCIPEDAWNMNLAANKGIPIVIERPRSRISKRFAQLATALANLPGIYDDARPAVKSATMIEGSKASSLDSHSNGPAIHRNANTNGKLRSEATETNRYEDELDKSSIELRL